MEDAVTHMHIGSVGIFEGEVPPHEEILAAVRRRLPVVPRYRQKVRFVPLALGRPVWVDAPDFDLEDHVRRVAVTAPGGERELCDLMGQVLAQQLVRDRPLWEMWVIEGLEDGRWGLVSKTHHCMVDGVSATDLLGAVLSSGRASEPAVADDWRPAPEPAAAELVARAVTERALSPDEGVRTVLAAVRGPRRLVRDATAIARGLGTMRRVAAPGSASSLNGAIGPQRRWSFARGRLTDVKAIRQAHGGTVNDVVLTVVAGGFRALLRSHGEPLEDQVVRTLVPVSVRAEHEHETYDNKVSAMFADLPVGVEDPVARLGQIHEQMQEVKASGQAVAAERLTALSGFAPPMLLSLGTRLGSRLPQRAVNTVTTNVPGPQQPLYLCGRRMLEAFPFVPIGGSVRIGVAIFSYDGSIGFGVTGDHDLATDIATVCTGIESSLRELMPKRPRASAETKRQVAPRGG